MKQYGFNQATEFSKKQIGVIYRAAKSGDLKVEKWFMSRMYDLADFYGMDSNGSIAKEEQGIKRILEAVFAGNLAEAQERIENEQQHTFSLFTEKAQKSMSRELVA